MKRIIEATMAWLIALSFVLPTAPNVPDRGQLEPIKAKSERTAASVKRGMTHVEPVRAILDDYMNYLAADFENAAERAIDGRRSDGDTGSQASDIGGAVITGEPLPEPDIEGAVDPEPELGEDSGTTEAYEPDLIYAGEWVVTFYCDCPECCGKWSGMNSTASGQPPIPWYTIAAGSSYPFGTLVYIEDFGTFEIMDRGVDDQWADIFVSNHGEIPSYGITTKSVYIVGG